MKLASEVVEVNFEDPEVKEVSEAINADRRNSEIWDYLNHQIAVCNRAKDKTGAEDDKHGEWSRAFVGAYLRGGKDIESQPEAYRSILWYYYTKALALPRFQTPEELKADWERSVIHFRQFGYDV